MDPQVASLGDATELRRLHQSDLDAGAEWLTSATFALTDPDALRLALVHACSFGVPVMASLGPLGSAAEICARAERCLSHGAQLICLETFLDDELLCEVLRGLRGVPTLASFCPLAGAVHSPERFLEAGAGALGVNCGYGLSSLVEAGLGLVTLGASTVIRPSAGLPQADGSFPVNPEAFAAAARRAWAGGVNAVGGCCGVESEHLHRARKA